MNQASLEDMTLSELNKFIISLKTKRYVDGVRLTPAERRRYREAKASLYMNKVRDLPPAPPATQPVGSSCDIWIDC